MSDSRLKLARHPRDVCVFLYVESRRVTLVIVFVDDLYVSGPDKVKVENALMKIFPCRDLGRLTEYLGVLLRYSDTGIYVHQKRYVEKFVKKSGAGEKGVLTPIERKLGPEGEMKIDEAPSTPAPSDNNYRVATGTIGYAAVMTRADLSLAQGHFSRFLARPTASRMSSPEHYKTYFAGTPNTTLHYQRLRPGEKFRISASADSDWRGCRWTSRATGGHLIMLSNHLVMWSPKMMESVTMSSAESEHAQLSLYVRDCVFLRTFLESTAYYDPRYEADASPLNVEEDNKGARDVVTAGGNSRKLRHLQHHEHYCRDMQTKGVLQTRRTKTDETSADVMTKPAASRNKLASLLGKYNLNTK